MSFFSKIGKKLKGLAKIAIKTAPLWSSFIPGGSIAGKLLQGGKMGGKLGGLMKVARGVSKARGLLRHAPPRVQGLTQMVRQSRHVAPGRVPMSRPGGWARQSMIMPTNPFRNGRFNGTHMRKLAALHSRHPGSGVYYGKVGRRMA